VSNEYFPSLPGLAWDVEITPEFATTVLRSVNLSELRASYTDSPIWHFKLTYDVLRQDTVYDELNQLAGFFMRHLGRWDSWLYSPAHDIEQSGVVFAVADGTTDTFQLARPFGGFNEPVAASNANITAITVNNSSVGYNIAANGMVTLGSTPAANAVLRWSGAVTYRCRFEDDTLQFVNFMHTLWEAKTVEFIGSLGQSI
jgi:hypothetical protein